MAVKFYDIRTDELKVVTQQDVDEMQAAVQAYGRLRLAISETHDNLQTELAEIRAKYARQRAIGAAEP